jgi:ribosomal protein L37AE/L43A
MTNGYKIAALKSSKVTSEALSGGAQRPKVCKCDRPVKDQDEDGTWTCFKCGKRLAP